MSKRSKHLCIGPGGPKCVCCFPAPGSKERRLQFRRAKRLDHQDALKEAVIQLADKEIVDE